MPPGGRWSRPAGLATLLAGRSGPAANCGFLLMAWSDRHSSRCGSSREGGDDRIESVVRGRHCRGRLAYVSKLQTAPAATVRLG
jgi:hypothetical protein